MYSERPTVVVIGNFDGVHRGHRELLRHARAEAPDLPLVVVTFWPHPQSVITPGSEPALLTDLPARIQLLRQAGADEVRVVHFTNDLMGWTPEQFVERVLLPLNPAVVSVGTNFTFGRRATGTVETLRQLGSEGGGPGHYRVAEVDLLELNQVATCSSRVRESLDAGDVASASNLLGRHFRYSGVVVMGHQRGRELGFPTANLPVERGHAAPGEGVYAGWLTIDPDAAGAADLPEAGVPLPAAISVGTNPTFDDVPDVMVEAYVLDRTDLELYGRNVHVDFVERLRGNVKFEGPGALVEQMGRDVQRTRQVLSLDQATNQG